MWTGTWATSRAERLGYGPVCGRLPYEETRAMGTDVREAPARGDSGNVDRRAGGSRTVGHGRHAPSANEVGVAEDVRHK